MTARELIIKLVDEDKITGEEAFILMDAMQPKIIYQTYPEKPWWYNPPFYTTSTSTDTSTNTNNYSEFSVKSK